MNETFNIILFIALAAIFFCLLTTVFRKKSQCKPPITVLTRKFYNSILCYNSLACGWRKIVSFFKRFFHGRGGKQSEIKQNVLRSCGALRLKAQNYFDSLSWTKKFILGYITRVNFRQNHSANIVIDAIMKANIKKRYCKYLLK